MGAAWSHRLVRLSPVAALLVAVALAWPALAATQGSDPDAPREPARAGSAEVRRRGGALAALGLTDEQRRQIQAIRLATQERLLPVTTELFGKRQELMLALQRPEPDAARVKALVEQIGRLRTQMESAWAEAYLEMRAVLTAEQRERLATLGMGAGWGRRGPHPVRMGAGLGMGPAGFCPGGGWMGHR